MNTSARPNWFSVTDIGNLIGLPILTLLSWLLPRAAVLAFCRAAGPLNAAMLTSDKPGLIKRIEELLGDRPTALAAAEIPDAVAGEDLLALMTVLRSHMTRSWRGRAEIHGLEHLQTALEGGNGAVLWRGHFVHFALPYYWALQDAGFAVAHFAHVRHGFSDSRFGIRFLNPIRTIAENRFLAERVARTDSAPTAALRRLMKSLAGNGIVSISSRGDADQLVSVPFLGDSHEVGPGAPHLAYVKGAALLPVFPVRHDDDSFTIHIEAPIEVDRTADRRAAIEQAAAAFAIRLERRVLASPSQWQGGMHL